MCEYCPLSGDQTCSVCGARRLDIRTVVTVILAPANGVEASVYDYRPQRGTDRQSIHQRCGGGRRIVRKRVGHS